MLMGLVYKDLMVMKKQLLYYLFFFGLYAVLSVTGTFSIEGVMGVLAAMVGMMVPISSIAYDDQARWTKFAVATPAGRKGVAAGKYLLALLTILCSGLLAALLGIVLLLTGAVEGDLTEAMVSVAGSVVVAVGMNDILLPLVFKYGSEKARLAFFAVMGVFFLLLMVFGQKMDSMPALSETTGMLIVAGVVAAVAVGMAVSYRISLAILEKKEL